TEASHAEDVRAQLPEIPTENILVEPTRRGTAAAVGLAAAHIAHRDPAASMAPLHSDAAVADADEFGACLTAAFEVAESDDWLVTLGIRPTHPHTGMGYIQVGQPMGLFHGRHAFRAVRFVEKPDRATAEQFIRAGYVWNPGMFVWRVDVILREYARLLPDIADALIRIQQAIGTRSEAETLRDRYGT